jgi:hypothetical protein
VLMGLTDRVSPCETVQKRMRSVLMTRLKILRTCGEWWVVWVYAGVD